jgi:hypothetical protein
MTRHPDLLQIIVELETTLVRTLELQRIAVPRELARLDGSWHGQPATLEVNAYAGPRVRYARFVRVWGRELAIGNALALSDPELALPILGVDLVGISREMVVAVADLSPVVPSPSEHERRLSAAAREAAPNLPQAEVPAWCRSWLSPDALVTRVSATELPGVAVAVAEYGRAFVELARRARSNGAGASVEAAQREYGRVHRADDRGLKLLGKIFDASLAARFLDEVLFPDEVPAWR